MYKYDVAFSFLERDHDLALTIDNLIKYRISSFIYSKKQNEIAGQDGEKLFNQVFERETRTIVILYRGDWGSTPWTRIEETAIRNRGYVSGYDFATLILLDKNLNPPQWFPKNRIWVGFDRWGIDGVATLIEDRVHTSGGTIKEEDIIKKLDREIKFKDEKKKTLSSEKGVLLANAAVDMLFSTIQDKSRDISSLKLEIRRTDTNLKLCFGSQVLLLDWQLSLANSLDYSLFSIRYGQQKSIVRQNGFDSLKREEYQFDLNESRESRWRDKGDLDNLFTNEALAEHALSLFLKEIMDATHSSC